MILQISSKNNEILHFSSFCSRRLRRIRKSLELTYGNHKKFQKPVITDELVAKDSRYAELIISPTNIFFQLPSPASDLQ